jgi:hypothetical protein
MYPFCVASAGNVVSYVQRVRNRMIMSEKPNDGTVVMHYGEADEFDVLSAEDYLPTLPNTVSGLQISFVGFGYNGGLF